MTNESSQCSRSNDSYKAIMISKEDVVSTFRYKEIKITNNYTL